MSWYKSFKVPVAKEMEICFERAAMRLEEKLKDIDVELLTISPYSKKYFKDYQRKLRYSLQACSFILMHAIEKSEKEITDITLVDYGAGTGVLAMLAKEVGFGKVIYNDIYDVSCNDAKIIAIKAGAAAHEYVCGETKALQAYFEKTNGFCDIIVSRNVIEHIYDLEAYFKALTQIPNKGLTLFFATTANIKNPLTVWYTKSIQRMLEFKGMTTKWGKERDTLKPYLITRKELIKAFFPELTAEEIEQLAVSTRGLMIDDIKKAVISYKGSGKIPSLVVQGCNTCDPHTGNWAEHLIHPEKYKSLFESNGFEYQMLNGFYNTNYAKKWLNIITPILNIMIKIMGKKGIFFAPFIGLKGQSKN